MCGNKMKVPFVGDCMRIFFILFLAATSVKSQTITGTVIDALTQEPLPFVHVGVTGKNLGTIADDRGRFTLDLDRLDITDSLTFSSIGYGKKCVSPRRLTVNTVVELSPRSYALRTYDFRPRGERLELGRRQPTKTTTGQKTAGEFGFGQEWGLKIDQPDAPYRLETVRFHTRFNTADSILFRINVYTLRDGLPHESLLQSAAYTTSRRKEKWIEADLSDRNIWVDENIVVTVELVRIWYRNRGKDAIFFTHADDLPDATTFHRESSLDRWRTNEWSPFVLSVVGTQ